MKTVKFLIILFAILILAFSVWSLSNYEVTVETGTYNEHPTFSFEPDNASKEAIFLYTLFISMLCIINSTLLLMMKSMASIKKVAFTTLLNMTALAVAIPRSLLRFWDNADALGVEYVSKQWYVSIVLIEIIVGFIVSILLNRFIDSMKRGEEKNDICNR